MQSAGRSVINKSKKQAARQNAGGEALMHRVQLCACVRESEV